ncbi:transglutaminase family protein [Sphingomonas arantia]|uniref:Transglutaminase family protein n=1 Tax=Sphingomonas arantia TaxID=1460676 RepID=A0ABW4TRJ4_9SPHN
MHEDLLHLGLVDDDAIALDLAALDLAALDHPGVDLDPAIDLLAAIADGVRAGASEAVDADARAAVLAEVIAGTFGFVGDREAYDDPANADLIQVMARRRGLPVSLSIIYVATARRLGWTADALDIPGHVLVRIGGDGASVLIDPFRGGMVVGVTALMALLGPNAGATIGPMSNRSVLVRLLLNQAMRAEQAGQNGRALTLFERMTTIAPGAGHAWWERARLELAGGRVTAARASLSAMLEMTREPVRRAQIGDALAALAGADG